MNHVEKIHKFYKKNLKKIPHIGLTGLNPHGGIILIQMKRIKLLSLQ